MPVAFVDLGRNGGQLSFKGLAGLRLHQHVGLEPHAHAAGFEFRDAGFELHLPHVGDHHDRQVAGNGAGVVVALHHVAGDRRGDGGVALHFARAPQRRVGLRQVGDRKVALGDGRAARGLCAVKTLARQRALLEQVRGAVVLENGVGERRFRGFEGGLADRHGGDGGVGLRVNLATVDGGNGLALRHGVADVDQHAFDGARQLRLDGDAAERGEGARDLERRLDGAGGRRHGRDIDHGRRRRHCFRRRFGGGGGTAAGGDQRRAKNEGSNRDPEVGNTTIHDGSLQRAPGRPQFLLQPSTSSG